MKVRSCARRLALLCLFGAAAHGAQVIDNDSLSNEKDGVNWAAYGRTFDEAHYSPLTQITTETVQRLGLAWSLDLDVTNSITAPLEVNGVLYLGAVTG
jgi:quinohemoprotein ethanol dehydrogenase